MKVVSLFLSETNADAPACDTNANRRACFASHPSYCSSTSYADRDACSGAKPAYCQNVTNAASRSCAGPGKPSVEKILDTARKMALPVDVRLLMGELMR